jgi:hypothetical protein
MLHQKSNAALRADSGALLGVINEFKKKFSEPT